MNTNDCIDRRKLNELVNVKEQEWKVLLQQQVESLMKTLDDKDDKLNLEKLRFRKLKDDFEYNLKLLSERDQELARYDDIFQQIKANESLHNADVSEMKIKVADAESKYEQLQTEFVETQKHYQWRLKEYQDEMNKYLAKKDVEIEAERHEYQELKKKLQREVRDVEDNSNLEKQRIASELNDRCKQKEHEYQLVMDKKDSEVHSYRLKIKMLSRELDMIQASSSQDVVNLENNKEATLKLQKMLKEKEWELCDVKNMKDIEVQQFKVQIDENKKQLKCLKEGCNKRCTELERSCNERESIFESFKLAADESEVKLRSQMATLQQKIEEQELTIKRLHWNHADQFKVKDNELLRLKENVHHLELKLKQEHQSTSKSIVARDLEVETLRSSEDQLRQHVARLKIDIDRYKKEAAASIEHERILENAQTQMEIDWRRRLENKESELYQNHEELIRNLTIMKAEAVSQVQEKSEELVQRDHLIKLLQADNNKAIKFFENNGINYKEVFMNTQTDSFHTSKDNELKLQNDQLREVIKNMRTEMEMLTHQINSRTSTPEPNKSKSYVKDLEDEVQRLKIKNRELLDKIEEASSEKKPPSGKLPLGFSDVSVKSHVKELNDTVGHLRNEKVQLTAMLTSKQANIQHLTSRCAKCEEEKSQLHVVIESLTYDLTSTKKAHEQSVQSMKHRISELELQLQQSRSEAEIYYKSVVERNLDATRTCNKLSELKLQSVSGNYSQPIQYHFDDDPSKVNLKEKLKLAVDRIKELTKERLQLINVSNKLRAELSHFKEMKDAAKDSNVTLKNEEKSTSHLDDVENVEYEETIGNLRDTGFKSNAHAQVPLFPAMSTSDSPDVPILDVGNNAEKANDSLPSQHSSSEHSSMKEIWKLLDKEDSTSTPGTTISNEDGIAVVGRKAVTAQKRSTSKVAPVTRKSVRQSKNKSKVRNYNIKDDRS